MDQVAFKMPSEEIVADFPIIPLGWRVLVRPYRPKDITAGGIALPEEAIRNEEILTNVGQIITMGTQCFTAITRSGIDMSKVNPKPKVGDWIMYGAYGGQQFFTKGAVKYTVINDDSIMGVVLNPHVFKVYI